ncbi:MAG: heterodisulfide reductase-related iron-sulfur binding cluster [Verrucomicrobia bacterium]|nr:heterodisulfide reductase-related iron-sulfur binding cluster [Verrucomicrobiota bacterium]MDA1065956.1 heterodisulfide reductase-related iron-sulfur binding cluster [Verrucomicrobiota bacterium]
MQHIIDKQSLGPNVKALTQGIEACVHCGFCLPTCPTYEELGEEINSPRGRIFLMKEVLEGAIPIEDALDPIDNCLGCDACITACPSGVEYDHLITAFRAKAEKERPKTLGRTIMRSMILNTLPYPNRAKWAFRAGGLFRPLRGLFPKKLQPALELLPASLPKQESLPDVYPASGPLRGRVALLTGCVQQVLAPEINRATLEVLSANGIETLIPREQSCCGALALHTGAEEKARKTARQLIRSIPADVDALITNAAGCGSGINEYSILFAGEPDEAEAIALASRTKDISTYLHEVGLIPPPELPRELNVVYHDACHLAHAQRELAAPRAILSAIPNLNLLEPPDWEICCGSAGIYNIEKPGVAKELGRKKVNNLMSTQPDAIALGNIGCMTQIQKHLEIYDTPPPVLHTVQILAKAYARKAG